CAWCRARRLHGTHETLGGSMETKSIERRRGGAVSRGFASRAGLAAAAVVTLAAAADAHAEVRARFSPSQGTLTVIGSRGDDRIRVSRFFSGAIRVNDGATPIRGGSPDVNNTRRIVVRGGGGNDQIVLDESEGALPRAVLSGGPG